MELNIKTFLDELVHNFGIYEDVSTTLIDEVVLAGDERGENVFRTSLKNRTDAMFEVLKTLERVGSITKEDVATLTEGFGVDIELLSLSDKIEYFGLELPDETKKD